MEQPEPPHKRDRHKSENNRHQSGRRRRKRGQSLRGSRKRRVLICIFRGARDDNLTWPCSTELNGEVNKVPVAARCCNSLLIFTRAIPHLADKEILLAYRKMELARRQSLASIANEGQGLYRAGFFSLRQWRSTDDEIRKKLAQPHEEVSNSVCGRGRSVRIYCCGQAFAIPCTFPCSLHSSRAFLPC